MTRGQRRKKKRIKGPGAGDERVKKKEEKKKGARGG